MSDALITMPVTQSQRFDESQIMLEKGQQNLCMLENYIS